MSTHAKQKRLTTASIRQMKGGARIVCLTAYTTPITRLLDPHCDLLLVGDSVGMVLYGMDTTVGVTLDMMIAHGRAVMRGVEHACVIVDLPFGTYQESKEQAFRNAVRLMQETGCDGVKLEGGEEMAETIAFLVGRGIPVFGHVGLMPQTGSHRRRFPLAWTFGCGNAENLARCDCGRSGRCFRHCRRRHRRAACARIDRKTLRPDCRHRRITGLRWAGAGFRRHARALHRFQTEIRQTFRRSGCDRFTGSGRLCRRGALRCVSGAGAYVSGPQAIAFGGVRKRRRGVGEVVTDTFTFVMLGLVPSICYLSIL